jgi:methylenetetrahydrofolate reductase (NADPH)
MQFGNVRFNFWRIGMSNVFERGFTRGEHFVKGVLFDCHHCGQCVLSHTGLVCPMACPRQLRNGPCGGSMDGMCEVHPDRKCVHARINQRVAGDGYDAPALLPPPDPRLFFTSSWINYLNGKDKVARTPLEYLPLGENRKQQPPQTASLLEEKLKRGQFVFTSEIRSPRTANVEILRKQALILKDHFDAVNATAFLNGKPSMPSSLASAEMVKLEVHPICQSTCRDHTLTSFISELVMNQVNGVDNLLCLTGDYYQGTPCVKQSYVMDSALAIYEARYLREKGIIHFSGDTVKNQPRPFIGGAINPFSDPINMPVRRLKQKILAGVDFVQTQVIFDLKRFRSFMDIVTAEGLDRDVFIVAGLPVIISKKALEMMSGVPGICVDPAVKERFDKVAALDDPVALVDEGIAFAREMIAEMRGIAGVSGVHLMLFGMDHTILPRVMEGVAR